MEIYRGGINSLQMKINFLLEEIDKIRKRKVQPEQSFHFYYSEGRDIGKKASSLEEFLKVILTLPLESMVFHHRRGDFANWLRCSLYEKKMADKIDKIESNEINLRDNIYNVMKLNFKDNFKF